MILRGLPPFSGSAARCAEKLWFSSAAPKLRGYAALVELKLRDHLRHSALSSGEGGVAAKYWHLGGKA